MTSCYALIDLENIQPDTLHPLKEAGYQLRVFVGATQTRISVELARQVQAFGNRAEYIQIESTGKNALDFHIAFYMGQLAARNPGSQFLVITRDTGFDPLLQHLRKQGIQANRRSSAIPPAIQMPQKEPVKPVLQTPVANTYPASPKTAARLPAQMSEKERLAHIHQYLNKAGRARPGKHQTLANMLDALFRKQLDAKTIEALIKQGVVSECQGTIYYTLTAAQP